MYAQSKASGKKRNLSQAKKPQSVSQSVSLPESDMSDKTRVQRWILSRLGGAENGKKESSDSGLWYSDD